MNPSAQNPLSRFLKRLLLRSILTAEEQAAVLALGGETQHFPAHRDIVSPGECVDRACLMVSGLAGRFDEMLSGHRQVTAFHIAGDMCDLHSVMIPKASWSITALSRVTVLRVPHSQIKDIACRHPAVAMAFWRDGVVDGSLLAKWAGNLGRKGALARIAHIFCEMGMRMASAEMGSRTTFELSATQEQIADAAGLTPVHVNRMLQDIRERGLLTFRGGCVEVLDWKGLVVLAEFDPAYLMLGRRPERTCA